MDNGIMICLQKVIPGVQRGQWKEVSDETWCGKIWKNTLLLSKEPVSFHAIRGAIATICAFI